MDTEPLENAPGQEPQVPADVPTDEPAAATTDEAPAVEPPAASETSAPKAKKRFSDLPVRIVSGAVYLVLFIACLMIGKWTTMALIAVLSAIGCWEFFRMERRVGRQPIDVIGIFAAALFPVAALVGGPTLMLGLAFLLIIVLLFWFVANPRVETTDVALTVFGPLYTGMMLSSFVLLRVESPGIAGSILALGVFLSMCVSDSAAYLVGSRFGKHKLVPKISPKKSWEGFVGGVVGAVLVWVIISLFNANLAIWEALILGVVTGVVGLLGDLAESRVKRSVGVKDSGNIMPGHGGILDRVDAMILVSFVSYLLLKLMGAV